MDFVKILRSLEEFLYELLSWLVFYPRTLLRILSSPVGVAKYTRLQLQQPANEQFLEMVSPVLTLILSILIAHGIEMAAGVPTMDNENASPLAVTLFGTYQGLLLSRGVVYGLYGLVAAVWVMTRTRTRIDRNTLREPFFIQSYLVSPFALVLSTGSVLVRMDRIGLQLAGMAVSALAALWYLWAQASVYRKLLDIGIARAFAHAVVSFAMVSLLLSGTAMLLLAA